MTESAQVFLVLGIMLSCGVLGGLVNYWGENFPKEERHPLLKRLSAGVAAAFVVPLFLNMISSSLLKDTSSNPISLFIFAGFCIIAAISSKAFIDSITKRVLDKVERVASDQMRLANEVEPVIAAQTEVAPPESDENEEEALHNHNVTTFPKPTKKSEGSYKLKSVITDESTKKVIIALGTKKYTWRSLDGITKDTQLPQDKIMLALDWLVTSGFAVRRAGQRDTLWALTSEGRSTFAQSLQEKDI